MEHTYLINLRKINFLLKLSSAFANFKLSIMQKLAKNACWDLWEKILPQGRCYHRTHTFCCEANTRKMWEVFYFNFSFLFLTESSHTMYPISHIPEKGSLAKTIYTYHLQNLFSIQFWNAIFTFRIKRSYPFTTSSQSFLDQFTYITDAR